MTEKPYNIGDPVWTKMKGYCPWPSRIANPIESNLKNTIADKLKKPTYLVYFFGSNNYAWMASDAIKPYEENKDKNIKGGKTAQFKQGLKQIQAYIEAGGAATLDFGPEPKNSTNNDNAASPSMDGDNHDNDASNNEGDLPTIDDEITTIKTKKPAGSKRMKNSRDSHNDLALTSSTPSSVPAKDYSRTPFKSQRKSASKFEAESTAEVSTPTKRVKTSDDDSFGASGLPSPTLSTAFAPNKAVAKPTAARQAINRPFAEAPIIETPQINLSSISAKSRSIRPSTLRFGFIGLGFLGQRLLKNLLNSGHHVTIYNRTTSKCDKFSEAGAVKVGCPADVISAADIVFLCLSDPKASKEIIFGSFGILAEMRDNKGLVEMSSIDPETSSDISEAIISRGGRYLEAPPIANGKQAAEDGELTIVAAGDKSLYEECHSCFQSMGKQTFFLGHHVGQATKMNLILSMLYGTIVGAVAECCTLVERTNELQLTDLKEILKLSTMNCPLTINTVDKISDTKKTGGTIGPVEVPLNHLQKDLRLALTMAEEYDQTCPITAITNEVFKGSKRCGYSENDAAAVYLRNSETTTTRARGNMIQRRNSCLLELEAADYFKLDVGRFQHLSHSGQLDQILISDEQNIRVQTTKPATASTSNRNIKPTPQGSKMRVSKTSNQQKVQQTTATRHKSPTINTKNRLIASNKINPHPKRLGSSSASTNSLPSISSSPSLSPSLVCPHLTLDTILSRPLDTTGSPHTIGLCAKCRLDPPPGVHSPLSPAFRPSLLHHQDQDDSSRRVAEKPSRRKSQPVPVLRRGYSDQQMSVKQQRRKSKQESLDFCLAPDELRRLQMSPTLRHSVEFIRNNTTEAGRVLRIYTNGAPFEKPLRVCVLRGEFANLDHLLDHINSRQLVPMGARYLFHLDGQLVYSENELKHGSIYIVSGTRNFDFKSNSVLKNLSKQQHEPKSRQPPVDPVEQQSSPPVIRRRSFGEMNRQQLVVPSRSGRSASDCSKPPTQLKRKGPQQPPSDTSVSTDRKEKPPKVGVAPSSGKTEVPKKAAKIKKAPQKEKAFGGQAAPKPTAAAELVSKSQLDLAEPKEGSEPPRRVLRAKSELSALGSKRKKNVTFVDTGRGSSPAISDFGKAPASDQASTSGTEKSSSPRGSLERELSTNEVGIQVSDSIEGFLIDLPIALPPGGAKRTFLKKGQGAAARGGRAFHSEKQPAGARPALRKGKQQVAVGEKSPSRAKVVTIRERQLSFGEMDKLKDLDHGDHHIEAHKIQTVTINLDAASDEAAGSTSDREDQQAADELATPPDRTNTISIGQEPSLEAAAGRLIESQIGEKDQEGDWQYPGGRAASATPTERPVSQSEANESVRARVITPTPSLSTVGGDSASLEAAAAGQTEQPLDQRCRRAVMGQLRGGLMPPSRNFRLVWVNGFAINDQYPDNTTAGVWPGGGGHQGNSAGLLSPVNATSVNSQEQQRINFKPSERFHNWLCHSRRHDELVYPAGSLVVLWCRTSNEQRYYAQHTANVSALALASLDTDLAASAQVGEPTNQRCAQVHLWSLTSLETLRVVDEGHFGQQRRVFSLKVRNTLSDGCELSVGARDERRHSLYVFFMDLKQQQQHQQPQQQVVDEATKQPVTPETTRKRRRSTSSYVLQASRPLQHPQAQPLLVMRLSNVRGERSTATGNAGQDLLEDVVLSFGRRHFQVWFADRKRQTLKPMPADSPKSPELANSLAKATCLTRVSPSELLLGDLDGSVSLLVIDCFQRSKQSTQASPKQSQEHRYSLKLIPLVLPEGPLEDQNRQEAVTCLTRISESLFVGADSSCCLRFWRIERPPRGRQEEANQSAFGCRLLNTLRLPQDLGFVCAIIVTRFNRPKQVVEFYVASTSNAILFGSIQLGEDDQANTTTTISVLYEGHESSVMDLVADRKPPPASKRRQKSRPESQSGDQLQQQQNDYFTCSLDCKICKWSGRQLVWKSMLPSACASLTVHPIGFVLAVGSADGTVYILDKISGLLISYFPLTPVCINCLAYSRDGSLLAAGCSNGSIFILPVYERGLKYKKVSIFQSPHPVVSLQFSLDNRYILTSVTHGQYQELILWDLPHFRYMRDNVTLAADKIAWFDSICSGSEDVRAIWENSNLDSGDNAAASKSSASVHKSPTRRLTTTTTNGGQTNSGLAVNLSCHRLVRDEANGSENMVIASDTRGYLRLFRYPCYDTQQGFYEIRASSAPVNCCRFLAPSDIQATGTVMFVSSSIDGSIFLWKLC